jgi:hypothetical protein
MRQVDANRRGSAADTELLSSYDFNILIEIFLILQFVTYRILGLESGHATCGMRKPHQKKSAPKERRRKRNG